MYEERRAIDEKINILVVDDNIVNLRTVEGILRQPRWSLITATSGQQALDLVRVHKFALIILDVQIPGMDGFEVAERLRGDEKSHHIPIIFLTGVSKELIHVFTGYEKGAVDYLFKPLDPLILKSKVNVFVELFQQRRNLQRSNAELSHTIAELESVNRRILDQQRSVIEEERLKALLQMAGATAHELNQPLMILMGNVQLMEMDGHIPSHLIERVNKITQAANRISEIVKKIQNLRHDEPKSYAGGKTILNLDQRASILAIDAKDADFARIKQILQDLGNLKLTRVKTIGEALDWMDKQRFDLIFTDYRLPDGNGLEFLETISSKGMDTPVVVIAAHPDNGIAPRILQAGAYDYVPKAKVSEKVLLRIISNALEKAGLKREMSIVREKLAEMSVRDELTGMFNRRYFEEALEREIAGAQRYGHGLALCMLGLDHFERINDTYGRLCGDLVLREFGRMLDDSTRKYDVGCRYDGEVFAVILPDTLSEEAVSLCQRFREQVKEHLFTCEELELRITTSIGIAIWPAGSRTAIRMLVKLAEKALGQAKARGRDRVAVL